MSDDPTKPGTKDTKDTKDAIDRHPGHEEAAASAQAAPTSVEPVTPQDPQAAGAATGKQNELLQKNVSGSKQKGADELAAELKDGQSGGAAGVHATGSSTGTTGGQ